MIIERLKTVIQINKDKNPAYITSLLKEALQDSILAFVYNSTTYNSLIFTGGTCLKKVFGLNRLSEDLDFNYTDNKSDDRTTAAAGAFDIKAFESAIQDYFGKDLQFADLKTKLASNSRTVLLKFPVLDVLGISKNKAESKDLFVRCDFALENLGYYTIAINPIYTSEMTIYAKSFDLPTLFANKLNAFLTREYFKGSIQTFPFKGRDVYDIVWFVQEAKKSGWMLQPNWQRLLIALNIYSKELVLKAVAEKIAKIDSNELANDLRPFLDGEVAVHAFCQNFKGVLAMDLMNLLR